MRLPTSFSGVFSGNRFQEIISSIHCHQSSTHHTSFSKMNSLVYEWLAKLGLAEVAPTFEAAGIVAPKHLATLDVAYFESLGVTNPEQRRKLFYLCQRIKLAIEKSGRILGDDTEECVDAVISESFIAKNDATVAVQDYEATVEEEKKTDPAKPIVAFESFNCIERRRSKRLASKSQDEEEENKGATIFAKTTRVSARRAADVTAASKRTTTVQAPISTISRTTIPVKIPVKSRAISRVEPYDENLLSPTSPTNKNVFNLDRIDQSLTEQRSVPSENGYHTQKHELVEDHVAQATTAETFPQQQPSYRQIPRRGGAPASKLPGSSRTGKNLSAIPSESAAPSSPLVEFSSSDLNEEIRKLQDHVKKKDFVSKLSRARNSSSSKRRTTLAAGNNDELEELLQSSTSESSMGGKLDAVLADVSDSDNESFSFSADRPQILKLNMNRSAKSVCVADVAQLKQHQASQQSSRRSSTANELSGRLNMDRRQNSNLSRSDSTSLRTSTASTIPIVQGMSECTTWAAQIQHLREDNDDEYELFRDQLTSEEQEFFDMRIRVIVRKRPMSKSELSNGLDIIHPLDYSEFGKILVYQPKTRVDLTKEVETIPFAYDNVYGEKSTNVQIYERSIRNLILPFFEGQWATCFAYGQTGSGYVN
jgi:uncharacterized short protein YbdD (DUF466 family)